MIHAEHDSIGSVLIVDSTGETSEVLRVVLERRGLRILATSEAQMGLDLLREHHPCVTILDVETQSEENQDLCQAFNEEAGRSLVVLGKLPRSVRGLPRERVVTKPYHYAPLVRTIETLVEQAYPEPR